MDESMPDSHEIVQPTSHSSYNQFVRELQQRLYDGCSVMFTIPRDVGIEVAHQVLHALREHRGCLTTYLDLSSIQSIEDFADALTNAYLDLNADGNDSLGNMNYSVHMSAQEKVDCLVELSERIAKSLDTRLVVWFHEWQEVARMDGGGDLLLKRLRGMFQLQSHVTYAFTGSRDPDPMRKFFADRGQAFYRFAVELKYPV
ncbi:hypothetical protein LLE49_07720 [Alicyclobacillus tolerans]|uniref:hypothetical protein n=1 Tax=Alicyclobacillus tolerans TaxID=90970 RepID=UPI001F1E0484|nr:hypothetical protein [Alicyclobacillus tolerans]MCF8564632.1 hypothetical protein [Alicyclobacillus tolerans]